jgi:DNA-binding response OmpR family regulator
VYEQLSLDLIKTSILLPFYLYDSFRKLFQEVFGFSVLWVNNKSEIEEIVKQAKIDVALEWQHGPDDYPIRDILRKYNKNVPIFLCLNWNGKLPSNFETLGYTDYLNVPFHYEELIQKLRKVLHDKRGRPVNPSKQLELFG